MLSFEKTEYLDRLRKVKESMSQKGIDVLLVADPANMCYLTGYNSWSFYVHQMVVVMADEEEPIWFGRYQDALVGAKVTTWIKDENILSYSDDYVQSTIKHPMDRLADIMKKKGAGKKTFGVEMDAYYFSAKAYERLQYGLPDAKFQDGTNVVNWVRIIKSDNELAFMKRAARIVEKSMQVAIDSVDVGVRQCDAAAAIYQAQISGTKEFGGDYPAIVPLMPSGDQTGAPHLTWTDQKYKEDEAVIIEIAGCYQRYHSPMSRTV